jgi:hypothetical protein
MANQDTKYHVHIIPISRMVAFCQSNGPFHVCLTIRPSAHLVYATSHLSFVTFFPYLVSWLAMIFDFCESYSPFHVCLTIRMWSSAPPALCVTLLWVGRNPWYWTSLSKESLCLSLFLTFSLKSPLRIPFHVCLTIRPSAHLVYATSHLSFVAFYSYLISWLAMIWACVKSV